MLPSPEPDGDDTIVSQGEKEETVHEHAEELPRIRIERIL
jgi:hypothetical protein